jgi:hypothetical protein
MLAKVIFDYNLFNGGILLPIKIKVKVYDFIDFSKSTCFAMVIYVDLCLCSKSFWIKGYSHL